MTSQGDPVSAAMTTLNGVAEARRRIVEDPAIRGGLPVARGTRIRAHEIGEPKPEGTPTFLLMKCG